MNDFAGTLNTVPNVIGGFAAGKNKIINGDFGIWQRGTSFAGLTTSVFTADRWRYNPSGGTATITRETFTAGAAPVAGYESSFFIRTNVTSADDNVGIVQPIEDVRTFAGQTITVSFYAKATTGTPKIGVEVTQNFGTGGSPSAEVNTAAGAVTISTSWVRYSVSFTVPSISGKTLGTTNDGYLQANLWLSGGSAVATRSSSIGIQNNTFQIWGVQVEAGSVATAFQTATGTIQGELAACQRYFYSGALSNSLLGSANSTSSAYWSLSLPVTMRIAPTATYPGTLTSIVNDVVNAQNRTPTAIATYVNNVGNVAFYATGMPAVLTVGGPVLLQTSISWSAEL
jgi:hypothetical protein